MPLDDVSIKILFLTETIPHCRLKILEHTCLILKSGWRDSENISMYRIICTRQKDVFISLSNGLSSIVINYKVYPG